MNLPAGWTRKPGARFWDLIYALVQDGVTALVTTHYMDEAEYCGRVGIMRDGQLLAMDAPSALKEKALPGLAWDIFIQKIGVDDGNQLLHALDVLQSNPAVSRAGLVSDHLRAVTPPDVDDHNLSAYLLAEGIVGVEVNRVEPSLEDVFLALATHD